MSNTNINTNTRMPIARKTFADGSYVDIYDIELARQMGLVPAQTPAPAGRGEAQPKAEVEKVPYTKRSGKVIYGTPKQVAHWEAQQRANDDKAEANAQAWEQKKTDWANARAAYAPTQALIDAIKAKPTMTRDEAKALGFVGTSKDLWNLKYGDNGIVKKGVSKK